MQIDKYKQREKHNVEEGTLNSRVSALNNLDKSVGEKDELEVTDVEDWIDHLITEYENENIKAGTIKQYYKAVKYYWQKVHGDSDPIEHVRDWIPVGSTDHGDYLDREEWELMRETVTSLRLNAIIELMYLYARRPGEIRLIDLDDITWAEDRVRSMDSDEYDDPDEVSGTIAFNILKKDDAFRATYELRPKAEQAIRSYLGYRTEITESVNKKESDKDYVEPLFTTSHGRISYDTVWSNIKSLAEKAGIKKNITPKSMRHSRTTHLDWAGESPEVIARQQLVHDPDSDVVGHYIHSREEDDVREVMSLDDE